MKDDFKGKSIVLVDDDPDIVDTLTAYLTSEGFNVRGFGNAENFFRHIITEKPDLIILDIILPDMNGFQICKKIRETEEFNDIPIIILSGQDKEADKVFGLDLGADDYMVKPYSIEELGARVNAALRRRTLHGEEKIVRLSGDVVVDLSQYQVTVSGKQAGLTTTEFNILQLLALHKGQVMSRESILYHLWGDEKTVTERTIDVHVKHLREKLGDPGACIQVVRGVGYKWEEPR